MARPIKPQINPEIKPKKRLTERALHMNLWIGEFFWWRNTRRFCLEKCANEVSLVPQHLDWRCVSWWGRTWNVLSPVNALVAFDWQLLEVEKSGRGFLVHCSESQSVRSVFLQAVTQELITSRAVFTQHHGVLLLRPNTFFRWSQSSWYSSHWLSALRSFSYFSRWLLSVLNAGSQGTPILAGIFDSNSLRGRN